MSIGEDGTVPWEIVVTLEAGPCGGTVLDFSQTLPSEFSPSDVGPGWHFYLDRFGASLSGEDFPDWDYYPALSPR